MAYRYRRILVGVDFSPASREALARALDLARRVGARVEVLHVAEEVKAALPFNKEGRATAERLQREILAVAERKLGEWLARRRGADATARVLPGKPARVILEHAKRSKADLIVLANLGHGAIGELLLGSTADGVMRRAPVPVLLVPAPRAAAPRRR